MPSPDFDIAPDVGPCFVIVWLSFILYGLFLAQLYVYFTTYQDGFIVKLAVTTLGILETLQIISSIHVLYNNLIVDFGHPERLAYLLWSDILALSLEVVINGLVQSYYIFRIWRLCNNIPIVIVLLVELGARTAIGFKATSYPYTHMNRVELASMKQFKIFVTASLSLSVLVDVSVTSTLLFYLIRAKSLAIKRSTRSTMHRLAYYAVSTGALTALTTIATLIVLAASESPTLYGGLVVIIARAYANSMLAMLNIRQGLRTDMEVVSELPDLVQLSNIPRLQESVPRSGIDFARRLTNSNANNTE